MLAEPRLITGVRSVGAATRVRPTKIAVSVPETTLTVAHGPETAIMKPGPCHGNVTATCRETQDEFDRDGRSLVYVVLADGIDYSVAAAEVGVARTAVYDGQGRGHAEIAAVQGRAQAQTSASGGAP